MSVVIPTYNGTAYIAETLRSIFTQTQKPEEIIVVDDCSKDDTLEVVQGLTSESPVSLRILRMERNSGGPAAPMNRGISEARGEFIAMLDQDDLMLPKRIELALAAVERYPAASLVFGNYIVFNELGDIEKSRSNRVYQVLENLKYDGTPRMASLASDEWKLRLYLDSGIQRSCSNQFFARSTWQNVGGYRTEAGLSSDYDFAVRAFGSGVVWLEDLILRKREHESNAIRVVADPWGALAKHIELQASLAGTFGQDSVGRVRGELAYFHARHMRWLRRYRESRQYALSLISHGRPLDAAREWTKTTLSQLLKRT